MAQAGFSGAIAAVAVPLMAGMLWRLTNVRGYLTHAPTTP